MKRMIVDLSSVSWMSLLAGKDRENGLEVLMDTEKEVDGEKVIVQKKVWVNSAGYGYENAMNHLIAAMNKFDLVPSNLILVRESGNTKTIRQVILPQYKAKREERPAEAYEQFNKLNDMLCSAWLNVGAQVVTQPNIEGDDIIGYLAKHLEGERIIQTNDGDLAVLIGDGVHLHRGGELDQNPYGPFDVRFIPVYKALVGDSSDNIPGAYNFGEKAWFKLYSTFGREGVEAMLGLIQTKTLPKLAEDIADMKELQRIIDSDTLVYKSYAVACLMPEKVNTKMSPLIWKAGLVRGPDVVTDERLRPYCQQVRLIVKGNYEQAKAWMADRLKESPQVALDIETSTPDESDEWLMGDDKKVDVLGSKLTGMGLTFGANGQYTFYFSVDHKDTDNVTSEEVADIVATIKCPILVQNFGGFEGPILYRAWGERLKDNGWHGFLPNVIDTKVLANYTDENVSSGLKQNTELYTGYKQVTYDQVTSKEGTVGTLTGGRVVAEWKVPVMVETLQRIMDPETEQWNEVPTTINKLDDNGDPVFIYMERRRYKMNQLTGKEVLAYGADDTICTTALYQHYRLRMEIEGSWQVAMELEQAPMYVTALAFVNGTVFSQQTMKEQEQEDQIKADAAWAVIREYLISIGWEGSVCPVFKELDAANIKTAVAMLLPGVEFKTQVRTPAKLAILVEALEHPDAANLAKMITLNEVEAINAWMASVFDGEPVLDLNSPKQMKAFLYDTLKLPVRLVNPCTPLEFKEKPALSKAISKFKKIANGSQSVEPLTEEELELVKKKARTDDTSMDFALAFDVPDHPVLKALKEMKTCGTRQSLFYTPYRKVRHWVDGKIHAQANLTSTVTRRAAPSSPNLAQLPKRGEGVKFRRCFLPHHPNAVMVSVDSSGQELRLQAGLSKDPEMLSCYVGDNLRDLHSITASGAMRVVWSKTAYDGAMASLGNVLPPSDYETFLALLKSPDKGVAKQAKDLRTLSKGVNFGSAYGCEAPKMQELLVTDLETATNMLEAKLAKFCGYEVWKEKVEEQAMTEGLVRTELGGIRHLAHVMSSENRGERERAARQASNFKIQSAGAELAKKALTHIWNSGILFRYDCVFFALIHDECVLSVHRDHAVEVIKVVQAAMSLPYTPTFPVPFIGSVSLGLNFGDQIECGDGFFPDRIRAALAECFPERLAA